MDGKDFYHYMLTAPTKFVESLEWKGGEELTCRVELGGLLYTPSKNAASSSVGQRYEMGIRNNEDFIDANRRALATVIPNERTQVIAITRRFSSFVDVPEIQEIFDEAMQKNPQIEVFLCEPVIPEILNLLNKRQFVVHVIPKANWDREIKENRRYLFVVNRAEIVILKDTPHGRFGRYFHGRSPHLDLNQLARLRDVAVSQQQKSSTSSLAGVAEKPEK